MIRRAFRRSTWRKASAISRTACAATLAGREREGISSDWNDVERHFSEFKVDLIDLGVVSDRLRRRVEEQGVDL